MSNNFTPEQMKEIGDIVNQKISDSLKSRLLFKKTIRDVELPDRATEGSAGWDVFAPEDFQIRSDRKVVIDLGFATAIPHRKAAILMPRSGLGSKDGVVIANTFGLMDSDYRDTWYATVYLNQLVDGLKHAFVDEDGVKVLNIKKGQAFAQFFIVDIVDVEAVEVDELNVTDRDGGYGHTGMDRKVKAEIA